MAVRSRALGAVEGKELRRRLYFERLEDRRLLSLSHLYTFNDGLANDWIGSAHATLFNGATIAGGQLVLANSDVTSGQSSVVQFARLGANPLPGTDATIEVWFTSDASPAWARVFDLGNQLSGAGESYLAFTPNSGLGDARALLRPAAGAERIAGGVTVDDGLQHMATIVVDTAANSFRLYVDGIETGTAPLDGASAGSVNDSLAYLGRSLFDADPGFTGSINELRMYDEARSAADIAADAAAGPSAATKSPLVRQMEYLDRGMVAVRRSTTQAYVGWRLLGTDPGNIAFNLYRSAGSGAAVKLNATPLTTTTDFVDSTANFSITNEYLVRPVLNGVEQDPSASFAIAANVPVQQYLNVPLQIPAGGTTPSGENYTYSANDTSVGDVDGDGKYELIVKWDPSNSKDNSQSGYTGNVYIDAYKLNGTRLWRIDLGRNIRAGAHYTQFMVYDLDGDGRAEVAMKTAPGTIDGQGNFVLLGSDDPSTDYRNSSGYVLAGPEYLTVFSGISGAALSTVPYIVPRHPTTQDPTGSQLNDVWGDSYGNRVDRFLAGIAYLDGVHPSLVMARGYYTRSTLAAWDFRDGQLQMRWLFDTSGVRGGLPAYTGQGAHSLTIGDVDGDGKDEIIYGAMALDDDGLGLYATGLGHGDALHLSDLDPNRPGQEVFMVHETPSAYQSAGRNAGGEFRDARTGELIFQIPATGDVGRGVAGDIWAGTPGAEMWASGGGATSSLFASDGSVVGRRPGTSNFLVWWDADLVRELFDGQSSGTGTPRIDKYGLSSDTRLLNLTGTATSNTTKSNPALIADILGDWREEVIVKTTDSSALRIYTTTNAAANRLYTLMHDTQYRESIATQNSAYNQPSHPSFFLGAGMAPPPVPSIYTVQYVPGIPGDYNDDQVVDAADYSVWRDNLGNSVVLPNDITPGMVTQEDFDVWKTNFGVTDLVGGGAAAVMRIAHESQTVDFASAPLNSLTAGRDGAFAALAKTAQATRTSLHSVGDFRALHARRAIGASSIQSLLLLRRISSASHDDPDSVLATSINNQASHADHVWAASVDRSWDEVPSCHGISPAE